MHFTGMSNSSVVQYASEQAAEGQIDAVANLRGTPVYLYRGTKDTCYRQGMSSVP